MEALLLVLAACGAGYLIVVAALAAGQDVLLAQYGIAIALWPHSPLIGYYLLAIIAAAMLLALIPATSAWRAALATELGRGR